MLDLKGERERREGGQSRTSFVSNFVSKGSMTHKHNLVQPNLSLTDHQTPDSCQTHHQNETKSALFRLASVRSSIQTERLTILNPPSSRPDDVHISDRYAEHVEDVDTGIHACLRKTKRSRVSGSISSGR